MQAIVHAALLVLTAMSVAGCNREARGFYLPDGDAAAGKATFTHLACNDCHHVAEIARRADTDSAFNLALGGKSTRIRTYGELVTSIINPSHRIASRYAEVPLATEGRSAMRSYNEVMTVQQLVDLVTFLRSEYELELPDAPLYF